MRKGCLNRCIVLIFGMLLIGACASAPVPAPKQDLPEPPKRMAAQTPSPDTVMFQEGFALLGASDKPADYEKAGEIFDNIVRLYPKSIWRPYAETYRKLLNDLKLSAAKDNANARELRKTQKDVEELKAVLDQAKKSSRLAQEKLQAEAARLQQENDQLKNDLHRLKQLEIEMQRRERSLR